MIAPMTTGTVNAGIPSDAELIARLLESLREPYAYLRIDNSSETRSFGKREKEIVIDALTRLRASERKDSVSVPREPTEEMLNAAFEDYAAACYASPFGKEGSFAGAYRAMLA